MNALAQQLRASAKLARAGVDVIPITDRDQWLALRSQDVTASAVGCLLGVHEYQSAYGLWALKTGAIKEDPEETAPMRRGRLLEPVAIQLLREERPEWIMEPPMVYLRDSVARLGATPDLFVQDPERGFGIVQIKTVEPGVFRRKWRDEETGETTPPLWIAVQAITEAHLAGASWAAVAALTVAFGMDLHIVPVPIHDGVIDRVKSVVADFWRMIEEGRKPDPDYGRDGRLLEALYQPTGEIVSLESDNALPLLADERERLSAERSDADKRLKEIKTEFLAKLNGASAGRISDGRLITAKRIDKKGYAVKPSSYIDVRVKRSDQIEIVG
jgi:predicted phage-related endonuclease